MKAIVISYSLTGNNKALAAGIAAELRAGSLIISEAKPRSMATIFLDILFNRMPAVRPGMEDLQGYNLLVFVAPVWMGHVATPLRTYLASLSSAPVGYAFVSISGGADGPNLKLADELSKRTGKAPLALIDLHIADLLPPTPRPERKDTMAYRLKENDIKALTNKAVTALYEAIPALKKQSQK